MSRIGNPYDRNPNDNVLAASIMNAKALLSSKSTQKLTTISAGFLEVRL